MINLKDKVKHPPAASYAEVAMATKAGSWRSRVKCPYCYAYYRRQDKKGWPCPDCGRTYELVQPVEGKTFRVGGQRYRLISVSNHPVVPIKYGFAHETFRHPDLEMLWKKYDLGRVIKPYREEFKQQLAMRDWVCAAWVSGQPSVRAPVSSPDPDWHIETMITKARTAGHNYFCTYKAMAAVELASAFGWTARLVNIDGQHSPVGPANCGHMVYEIWSNQFNKWYFSDSLFNLHYEKDDLPLSVYEIRREYFKNLGKNIRRKWGIEMTPLPREVHGGLAPWSFEWYVVYLHNNFFDFVPGDHIHPLLMPRDKHNQGKRWRRFDRSGKGRGDIYICKGMVQEESDPYHLNYPINQTEIFLVKTNAALTVRFHHNMPNFSHLEVWVAGGDHRTFTNQRTAEYPWRLKKGDNALNARCVNTRKVSGPVSTISVTSLS